jgi:1,4-alpha-glucan branching enzyme
MTTTDKFITDIEEPELGRLLQARLHDPFRILGRQPLRRGRCVVRALLPHTMAVDIVEAGEPMRRIPGTDLFEWTGRGEQVPSHYRLRRRTSWGSTIEEFDPYCFEPMLDESGLEAFARGEHIRAASFLGAHLCTVDDIEGVRFAVWAPNAERVSVIGDFNSWDGRSHPLRVRGHYGVWELFIPGLRPGQLYKYEIRNATTGDLLIKADPFARLSEHRPSTASVITSPSAHVWRDSRWLERRAANNWLHAPLSIYEMHLGSWRHNADGTALSFREIAEPLAEYLVAQGFTHVELMPVTEHPLDESWGYQTTGYFAPTRRYGEVDDLKYLIDRLHASDIGVILDWVPGHFPRDAHGLANFDGTSLFEYADTRKGEHGDWGTLVFDYDRNEVRSFLISSAMFWLEEFHIDGLRVDAVASMIYLDYSRGPGAWVPNVHGGNENLEAIAFLQRLNEVTHNECPGSITIAEESTAYPGVSRPTFTGGLGFSMKWNMGWMHDTLLYFSKDPVHRKFHHNLITFGPIYAFSENFVLPFSHDEVVHRKGSVLARMPGDDWQRFANLRLVYTFQWTFPGKKLLFMGSEFGQTGEWDQRDALSWYLLEHQEHAGIQALVRDLNCLYRDRAALHYYDFEGRGYEWLCWDDHEHSVLSYLRRGDDAELIVLLNLTPVPRQSYRIGVPHAGEYREIFNSDSKTYGGSDCGNPLPLETEASPAMGHAQSVLVNLPPLAGIVLELKDSG